MSGSNNRTFWNRDAVVAVGLAFAGMMLFQSKLFSIIERLNQLWVEKFLLWWPLLLIGAGVLLWWKTSSDKRSGKGVKSASTQLEGGK